MIESLYLESCFVWHVRDIKNTKNTEKQGYLRLYVNVFTNIRTKGCKQNLKMLLYCRFGTFGSKSWSESGIQRPQQVGPRPKIQDRTGPEG